MILFICVYDWDVGVLPRCQQSLARRCCVAQNRRVTASNSRLQTRSASISRGRAIYPRLISPVRPRAFAQKCLVPSMLSMPTGPGPAPTTRCAWLAEVEGSVRDALTISAVSVTDFGNEFDLANYDAMVMLASDKVRAARELPLLWSSR